MAVLAKHNRQRARLLMPFLPRWLVGLVLLAYSFSSL